MTEPTTAAGRDEWHEPELIHVPCEHCAEARQQDASTLRTALERIQDRGRHLIAIGASEPGLPFSLPDELVRIASDIRQQAEAALASLPPSTPPALDVERLEQAWSNHMDKDHDNNDYDGCWPGHSEPIAAEYARLQEQDR